MGNPAVDALLFKKTVNVQVYSAPRLTSLSTGRETNSSARIKGLSGRLLLSCIGYSRSGSQEWRSYCQRRFFFLQPLRGWHQEHKEVNIRTQCLLGLMIEGNFLLIFNLKGLVEEYHQ